MANQKSVTATLRVDVPDEAAAQAKIDALHNLVKDVPGIKEKYQINTAAEPT